MADPFVDSDLRRPGRPRSESTRQSILDATIRLLASTTVQALTIEAIAREAGVGKATIYRWWDSKAMVVIDAFVEHHVVKTPMRHDLPPAEAIAAHFAALTREYAGHSGRIVAQIVAEGQADPAVLAAFRERFHSGRRAIVSAVLARWRDEGTIAPPDDLQLLADLIYAPIYMRLFIGHAPLDDAFARAHLAYVFDLLGVGAPMNTAQPNSTPALRWTSASRTRTA